MKNASIIPQNNQSREARKTLNVRRRETCTRSSDPNPRYQGGRREKGRRWGEARPHHLAIQLPGNPEVAELNLSIAGETSEKIKTEGVRHQVKGGFTGRSAQDTGEENVREVKWSALYNCIHSLPLHHQPASLAANTSTRKSEGLGFRLLLLKKTRLAQRPSTSGT